jgi:ATP-dependent helicase HrpB
LPIDEVLEPMLDHLETPGRNAVLLAPPGAGKTTCLPAALLDRLRASDEGEIIVAQPRRIAARMAAQIVARWRGTTLGEEVGYRVRFDSRAGVHTRLTFVTEGLLLRRLRDDRGLAGVAAIVFDEIHERHLAGDLALALARRLQRTRTPSLRIIAMSATLDPGPLSEYLEAPTFESRGRAYPVETEHLLIRNRPLEAQVLRALQARVEAAERIDVEKLGHVLVFLPGASEIRRCARALDGYCKHHDLPIRPLHASLSIDDQELAIAASARPKVILATNVAETSLTIDQVATVIDSGLSRVMRHDPGAGLPRLELQSISRASAVQRAGRAGRTRPGHCTRLYGKADFERRPERERPEVARADLSDGVFDLALAGVDDPLRFNWFETPPASSIESALDLLRRLGAIDEGGVTALGRKMGPLPLHPRLACAWVHAGEMGVGKLASGVVAILAERELRRPDRPPEHHDFADPIYELERLAASRGSPERLRRQGIDPRAAQAVEGARRALIKQLSRTHGADKGGDRVRGVAAQRALARALLLAFPDRLGRIRQRGDTLELLGRDGRATPLSHSCVVRDPGFALALRAESRQQGTRRIEGITAACAIDEDDILDTMVDEITEHELVDFDPKRKRVRCVSELRIGALTLSRDELDSLAPDGHLRLFEEAKKVGVGRFIDLDAISTLRDRARFVRESFDPSFPLIDEEFVEARLLELCEGKRSFAELQAAGLLDFVRASLGAQLAKLNRLAPRTITLPGGRKLSVDYSPGRPPSVASFLQDFFGSQRGPTIADGRVELTLHLRAPNRRDVQVTTDLAGFWERHYPDLRRQLQRRYPKHDWPEDPVAATPPKPRPRRGPRKKKSGKKR